MSRPAAKTNPGNFFEDFRLGQEIRHATPRTVTLGDVAVYQGLFGPRFALQSSDAFARAIGYRQAPLDDLLAGRLPDGRCRFAPSAWIGDRSGARGRRRRWMRRSAV